MNDFKIILKSVLDKGKYSLFVNELFDTCVRISYAAFSKSKYKEFVLYKTGLTQEDFAIDAVSDIFKETKGKYLYFNNYFENQNIDWININDDFLNSKLRVLIVSATNQKIVETREEYGEIYFKVKRAVLIYVNRKKDIYKKFIYNEAELIYSCEEKDLNPEKEGIPTERLTEILFNYDLSKGMISKMVDIIFTYINNKAQYFKAIPFLTIVLAIVEFLKAKKKNYLDDLKNVHYYIDEDI
jgi:hypothetical protein